MAICSRRTLQRLINENATFLKRKQIRTHVDKLNRNDIAMSRGQEPSLDTEWEVILLNAFSKVGFVEHERNFGGSRFPDLYFVAHTDENQCFIADITAISDKGFEGHNPYNLLSDQLTEQVVLRGLRPNSFSLGVAGNHSEVYRGGPKARLLLPPVSKFKEKIFNQRFEAFLDQIACSPNKSRVHYVV